MTDKFQAIVADPTWISLPQGGTVTKDEAFGSIEGQKLNADLISPVTGLILDTNQSLISLSTSGASLEPVIESPYHDGWMLVVQMSNPAELNGMMNAQQYAASVVDLG